MSKVHLHSEQFDGWRHPACGRAPSEEGSGRPECVVMEEDFEKTPRADRCRYCARYWWPHGHEPD